MVVVYIPIRTKSIPGDLILVHINNSARYQPLGQINFSLGTTDTREANCVIPTVPNLRSGSKKTPADLSGGKLYRYIKFNSKLNFTYSTLVTETVYKLINKLYNSYVYIRLLYMITYTILFYKLSIICLFTIIY